MQLTLSRGICTHWFMNSLYSNTLISSNNLPTHSTLRIFIWSVSNLIRLNATHVMYLEGIIDLQLMEEFFMIRWAPTYSYPYKNMGIITSFQAKLTTIILAIDHASRRWWNQLWHKSDFVFSIQAFTNTKIFLWKLLSKWKKFHPL